MNQNLKSSLQLAGAILVAALAASAARWAGLIDNEGATRFAMAVIGLAVAWYGNITPKEGAAQTARRIAYRRAVGYALAVAGLVNAAIWIWAPMAYAAELSMAPLAGALLVILGYCLWLRAGPAKA